KTGIRSTEDADGTTRGAQAFIDEITGSADWLREAYRNGDHPRHAEAVERVLAARRALPGGDEVVVRLGETLDEQRERAEREAEEAESAAVRFDPTVENPRHPENGLQLRPDVW